MPRALEQTGQLARTWPPTPYRREQAGRLVTLDEVLDHGVELGVLGLVDEVGLGRRRTMGTRMVGWGTHGDVVRYWRNSAASGLSRAGHPAELLVEAEIVWRVTVAQVWFSSAMAHALFGLDGLVQSVGPATASRYGR